MVPIMSIREHTALVALRGGLIGLIACGLATMIYLAGRPAEHPTGPAMIALPAGLAGGVLLARMLHLRRPWAVGMAGLVLSVAGAITAFVVIYRMLDMSEPMREHPAWPLGVLLVVVAASYAWAAVLAEPPDPTPSRHRYRYR
jgi:peptidoglycan/LPS O-acetylase OafA/YrhL